MIRRHSHGELLWVDVVTHRVDARDEYFYVVLHFPAFKHQHTISGVPVELDFIVGQKWIITTRYSEIDPLHQFSTLFEVDTVLDKRNMSEHAGFVFYYMLSGLYKSVSDELTHMSARLDDAEEHIFLGEEREMVRVLSTISRDVLNYNQALDGHQMMLQSLETPSVALFGYEYARHIRSLVGEFERLKVALQAHRESLHELRKTNDSLLSTKQNEIMKTFTILAFVTFPLTLFTSVFSMNTTRTPLLGHPLDFWMIVGIMLAVAVAFFAYFKYKKWL